MLQRGRGTPARSLWSGHSVVFIILLAVHAVLGARTIVSLSPTYDEPVHLAAGFSFIKTGDYRMNSFAHAPLAEIWAAMPQLFIKPLFPVQHPYWENIGRSPYPFSDLFLYQNRIDAEKLLHSGRYMILVLSLLLGIAIYRFSRELFGREAALCALFLWCFAPFFLANGTLVTTDMALTLFFFLSVYFFWHWWKTWSGRGKTSFMNTVLLGISIGCALASKQSAVALIAVLGGIIVYHAITSGFAVRRPVYEIAGVSCAIYGVLFATYGFQPLSAYYWPGLKKVMAEVAGGRSTFLMGHYSMTGWRWYFPVVFGLKTPLPLLLLLAVTPLAGKIWNRDRVLFLLWPAAFYFAASCMSTVQIGQRHILPVYPFLLVWVSGLYPYVRSRMSMLAALFLLIWYGAGTMGMHPWHLSYFNELIGSSDNGYRYLTDSNVDWGQGLKELGKYLKEEKITGIYLDYFGTGDPHYYGIAYRPIGFVDNMDATCSQGCRAGDVIDFSKQPRVLFAISATNAQATYYADKNVFAWLREIKPERIIANSILLYDLSGHPDQYRKFKDMFQPKEER